MRQTRVADQLHHLGAEHLLLGLLREGGNPAARVLVAHGLDPETVRAAVDRLIGQGVLPRPNPTTANCRPPWAWTWKQFLLTGR